MFDGSSLSYIDPDENYFNSFCPSIEGSSEYHSFIEYNDLFQNYSDKFSIISYNVRSFSANKEVLFAFLDSLISYPDILVLTETWFSDEYKVDIPDYNGHHVVRNEKRSGGVSVYVSVKLECKVLDEKNFSQ